MRKQIKKFMTIEDLENLQEEINYKKKVLCAMRENGVKSYNPKSLYKRIIGVLLPSFLFLCISICFIFSMSYIALNGLWRYL